MRIINNNWVLDTHTVFASYWSTHFTHHTCKFVIKWYSGNPISIPFSPKLAVFKSHQSQPMLPRSLPWQLHSLSNISWQIFQISSLLATSTTKERRISISIFEVQISANKKKTVDLWINLIKWKLKEEEIGAPVEI